MSSPTAARRDIVRLDRIPEGRQDLDRYEVDHLFHSWTFQPSGAPKRMMTRVATGMASFSWRSTRSLCGSPPERSMMSASRPISW